jgi:DNA-binding transcriptional regulator YiaG
MEEAVRNELRDISDLKINTVSDFSNAAIKEIRNEIQVDISKR